MGRPIMKTDIAFARCCGGYGAPKGEGQAGAQVASPTPTPRRTRNSCAKLRVRADTAVIRLQKRTPAARIRVRFERSARRPSGTPIAAYSRVKAVASQPT